MKASFNPYLLVISVFFFAVSCNKLDLFDKKENICLKFKNLHIKPTKSFTCGDEIILFVDTFEGARYSWTTPEGNNYDYQNLIVTRDAELYKEGWYHVYISCDTCVSIHDSVYVDINLKQGTPSCTTMLNTSEYRNGITVPTKNFNYLYIDSNSYFEVKAFNSIGDLSIFFHPKWTKEKLKPGIYYTSTGGLPYDKYDYDKVSIHDRYNGFIWNAENNQPVYVKYVNGKLSITYCDMPLITTDNGMRYMTHSSTNIILP
jgi:hypothetical protein